MGDQTTIEIHRLSLPFSGIVSVLFNQIHICILLVRLRIAAICAKTLAHAPDGHEPPRRPYLRALLKVGADFAQ